MVADTTDNGAGKEGAVPKNSTYAFQRDTGSLGIQLTRANKTETSEMLIECHRGRTKGGCVRLSPAKNTSEIVI